MHTDSPHPSPPSGRTSKIRLDQRPMRVLRAQLDFLAVLLGFWAGLLAHSWFNQLGFLERQLLDPIPYINLAAGFGFICVAVFWKLDLYREQASVLNLTEMQTAMKGVLLAAAIFLAVLFLGKRAEFSRFVVFTGFAISAIFILLERRLFAAFVRKVQLSGRIARHGVLIYGSGETGKLLMKKLLQAPYKACKVVGFIDDFAPRGSIVRCRIDQTAMEVFEARVLGRLQDLGALAREHNIDELLVTVSLTNAERHHELIRVAREANVGLGVVPRFGEIRADQLEVEDLSAVTVLRPSSVKPRRLYPAMKRVFDIALSTLLLVAMSPLLILSAILILVESGRPILFRQTRIGKDGESFRMLKFRTMGVDANPYENSPQGDIDPRVTKVGKFFRMGGFDELPQLVNVLRGEMSMVGPRPEMPFIVAGYSAFERQRLQVKPGITGVWQLSCDRHAEIHENLEYDLYYVRHQSLLLDALILLETIFFTIGLASNLTKRDMLREEKRDLKKVEIPLAVDRPLSDGYCLVALDQRREGTLPESWLACAPAFQVLACHSDVKVLVGPENVAAFDNLIGQGADGGANFQTEYVPYIDRSQLRALTLAARLVLTDLEHVRKWSLEGNVDVLFLDGDKVFWGDRSHLSEGIVADLAERLPIVIGADSSSEPAPVSAERFFGR